MDSRSGFFSFWWRQTKRWLDFIGPICCDVIINRAVAAAFCSRSKTTTDYSCCAVTSENEYPYTKFHGKRFVDRIKANLENPRARKPCFLASGLMTHSLTHSQFISFVSRPFVLLVENTIVSWMSPSLLVLVVSPRYPVWVVSILITHHKPLVPTQILVSRFFSNF